jgi:hypothetical protein
MARHLLNLYAARMPAEETHLGRWTSWLRDSNGYREAKKPKM